MSQESTGTDRTLVALIRADGRGELRDGGTVLRMRAESADELRGLVMERAMAIAADAGVEVRVRTVDGDGVYPLVLSPSGGIEQDGDIAPLRPEDLELTPEEDEDAEEPAAEGDAWLHETVRLPRLGMMAPLPEEEPEAERETPETSPEDETEGEPETELELEDELETELDELETELELEDELETETDLVPIVSELFGDGSGDDETEDNLEDDDSDLDEFHDEALDHDFDDLDEADETAAAEPVDEVPDPEREPEPDPAAEEWTPAFARDGRRGRLGLGGEPERAPGFPEMPLFEEPASEPEPAPRPVARPSAGLPSPRREGGTPGTGPTLDDFFAESNRTAKPIAEQGWRATLRRASGGLIALGPGAHERAEREELETIRRPFDGPRTIVVVNPKGGAHKTTATLMIAAMFGIHRGGYTLAWDNNETRGTLGWRSKPGATRSTAVDLLRELPKFEISGGASIADVDRYVRNQGYAKFDVLASDDDAASAAIIDDDAFSRLHRVLSRFYRVMVIDTGNNMRASNWEAALDVADQLVIVSTAREDTAASAAWLADGLRERGYGDKLANAVTVLSSPSEKDDAELAEKLERHFAQLTRAVVKVPYDHAFVGGGELDVPSLQPATREAWRSATAVIAAGL